MVRVVGIDGCAIGWVCVEIAARDIWKVQVYSDISEAWKAWNQAGDVDLVLIDIPIGLRDSGAQPRLCEPEARKCLGIRRSSVFTPPLRSSLDCNSYEDASKNNFAKSGKKLSKQAWGIARKIGEVDAFLARETAARNVVRETHPEVLFCKFNGGRPMAASKKKPEGFQERLELVSNYFSAAEDVIAIVRERYRKRDVASDDVLDALIAAIAARSCISHEVRTLPAVPEMDSRGLLMEIVFAGGQ